jgi:hypothetical protein
VLSLVVVATPGACGKSSPHRVAGSFVRQDALVPGLVTRLHVTPSGMTVTSPSASVGTSGSIEIRGDPLVKGSARMELGVASQGAALFSRLACDGDACAFATKNGCEGTLTADAKGDVVLVATGECGPWSGKWLREQDTPQPPGQAGGHPQTPGPSADAACPPPPVCPPPAACPPCASGSPPAPSATASAEPAPSRAECTTECGHAQMRCAQECKVGDTTCMLRCSVTVRTCVERCR